ncbi:hypothetical protein EYF80_010819 [Liparis tanakae]|uniref:Uncharacterized protein n=1 Tax=Liparis tanakae TaxID=230148 RepID=A0A4Z2INZ3_9TELE|nr:hypothetical protein EYF80_010819 [Liparis tanakae]
MESTTQTLPNSGGMPSVAPEELVKSWSLARVKGLMKPCCCVALCEMRIRMDRNHFENDAEPPEWTEMAFRGAKDRCTLTHQDVVRHLVVSEVEEVIPEALRDGGPDTEDLGDVLSSDHHVSVVKLDVHVRLLVQQVVGAACRSQANQLPEVTRSPPNAKENKEDKRIHEGKRKINKKHRCYGSPLRWGNKNVLENTNENQTPRSECQLRKCNLTPDHGFVFGNLALTVTLCTF